MNHCDQKAPKECLESRKHLLSSLKLLANELDKGASTMLEVLWTGCASSQGRHLVVIDTDPGIDDFLAILLALGDPTISLEAITCVRGNTPLPQVVVNLYRVLDLARRLEIPVYKGSDHGLVYTPPSDNFFGKDGFGGLSNNLSYYQCLASKVQKEHAASFLARIVREKPGQVTILAVAPLTNLALALHLNPNFLKQARKVIILGGTVRGSGNVRPGIEFNFYADPDAAAVVLDRAESCGTPVTLVPMETVVECDLGGVPTGAWSTRAWRLDSRLDLRGLTLNVTEVVKPNSVAGLGTMQASDASVLHDYDDIISYLTDNRSPHLDSMSKFSWAVFEIHKNLFNFSVRLVPTASWGYVFNGKFDGMVSLLMNGSADVGGTTLAIRPPRLAVVDYTTQIWPYQPLFILRHPRQGTLRDTFFRPLSLGVWLSSGLIFLLVFTFMRLNNWISQKTQLSSDSVTWSGSLIIIFSAATQQGSTLIPRQVSSRLLFFFLFAWAMILYQFYTSSIVSSLLSSPRRYINNLQELAHSPFTIGFEKVLTSKDTLTRYSAIVPEVRVIYEKHVLPKGDAAYYTPAQGIKCLQGGHFAFYVDTASAYRLIEETLTESEICDLVEITLNPKEVLSLPLQKGSPYRKLFIYGQRKMIESGIVKREVRRWQSRRPICSSTDRSGKNIPEKAQVGIAEISVALLLLTLGIAASLALLLCERAHFKYCATIN